MKSFHQRWCPAVAVFLCLAGAGCSTVKFYAQAIQGQREILKNARPMAAVMRDAGVSAGTKRKLALVQDARSFAGTHLQLPSHRLYDRYTDLGRRYVSWVVYAAPEFSVESKTWWYPLLGNLNYRGFFSKQAADAEADRMRARGYEAYVGGVRAYSTLGWFRDPVLNTFFTGSYAELAELVFHELTHVRLFLPGDTDFNEAFATANAEHGVRQWLKSKGDERGLARYEAGLGKDRDIIRLLLETRKELQSLYSDKTRTPEKMRSEKAAVFKHMRSGYARIRARWQGDSRYDRTFAKPWNNARLNTVATYHDLVHGFERLLHFHGGNVQAFYKAAKELRRLGKDERHAFLRDGRRLDIQRTAFSQGRSPMKMEGEFAKPETTW